MLLRALVSVSLVAFAACKEPAPAPAPAPAPTRDAEPTPPGPSDRCTTDDDCILRAGPSCSCNAVTRGTPEGGEVLPSCVVWPCWDRAVSCERASGKCMVHAKPKGAGTP